MKFDVKKTLLLIIDAQNDFCPGGALEVKDGDQVIEPLNAISLKLASRGGRVAATQDWHPAGHISFASSRPGKKAGDIIETEYAREQALWPDHCAQGTWGADFHKDLDLKPVSLIIRKGFRPEIDSYSAFFENDRKTKTGLEGYLRSNEIDSVILGGLATDYCVFFSAMDCKNKDFKTIIASDAVRGVGFPEGSVEKAIAAMRNAGIEFLSSEEILSGFVG